MAYYYNSFPVGPNTGVGQAMMLGQQMANGQYLQGQQGLGGAMANWSPSSLYTSSGGSGGNGAVSPYDLPGQYQQAYNEAKASNEQRYNDILTGYQDRTKNLMANQAGQTQDVLGGYESRYQRGMSNLEGLGQQQLRDTSQRYDQMQAANQGDLTSRGLTASTILPTMRQGVERQRSDALNRVNEQLQRERLGYDASLSGDALSAQQRQYDQSNLLYGNATGDTLQFAERRSDPYPDFNQLAALSQAYGAAGGQNGGIPSMAGVPIYQSASDMGYQLPGQVPQQQQQGMLGPPQQMNPLQQMQWLAAMQQFQNNRNFNPNMPSAPMEFNGVSRTGGNAPSSVDNSPISDEELWMMGIDPTTVRGGDRGAGSPVGSPQASPTDSTGMYDSWGNLVWNPNAWGGSTQPTGSPLRFTADELDQWAMDYGADTVNYADRILATFGRVPYSPQEAAYMVNQLRQQGVNPQFASAY